VLWMIADEVLRMRDGRIVERGAPLEVLGHAG
jgi:ABC-type antimicrobial peptide transport system ATPase subunit